MKSVDFKIIQFCKLMLRKYLDVQQLFRNLF